MNGAEALLRSLVGSGVEVCFANPGTSEMQFVAALDRVPEMRGVLTLFEGVATGAADGYGRIAGRPAAVLVHLGPGLANGLANLHNARRARTPLVTVVGDHATSHQRFDAQLQSDVAGLASTVSGWLRTTTRSADAGADAADAVRACLGPPGAIATLIVPADVTWTEGAAVAPAQPIPVVPLVPDVVVDAIAEVLGAGGTGGTGEASEPRRTGGASEPGRAGGASEPGRAGGTGRIGAILLGGPGLSARGLRAAGRVAAATGARLLSETFPAHQERGAGLPDPERLAYLGELALDQLSGVRHLVLAGARAPVSFFAYPTRPSDLVPPGTTVHELAGAGVDVVAALEGLADAVEGSGRQGATPDDGLARRRGAARPDRPTGALTPEAVAAAVGHLLPDGAIVVDESVTSGLSVPAATAGCGAHSWLALTGGAIGQGMPVATGAAVAAPERPVLCLEADGSAMYTVQALWTQAREGLDVTTVVLANRSYAILQFELARVGASGEGERAAAMLDLSRPELDFVALAQGMGVAASRATTAEELADQLEGALGAPGPHLIEAVLPGR